MKRCSSGTAETRARAPRALLGGHDRGAAEEPVAAGVIEVWCVLMSWAIGLRVVFLMAVTSRFSSTAHQRVTATAAEVRR